MKITPLAITLAAALAPSAASQDFRQGALHVSGAWSRATAPRAEIGAGYLTILNQGKTSDRLISATSPRAAQVEIHTMTMAGGVMRMRPIRDGLPIPARGTAQLSPGGNHLMLVGLKTALKPGERVPVTLHFQKAGAVPVKLSVGPITATGPSARHGGHH